MISSGWIIEPVVKGKEVFSMITYITQVQNDLLLYFNHYTANPPSLRIRLVT